MISKCRWSIKRHPSVPVVPGWLLACAGLCDVDHPGISDTGLTVSDMNEPLIRYDVAVTVARDGGCLPDPAEFAT
jgi:hypothetical protein